MYNIYFVAGNVDPTPPRPPKALAKPAARLAITTPNLPTAPVAAPGTRPVPRRPSLFQPGVPVQVHNETQDTRSTSIRSRSRTRSHHRGSHHRHHHRDHSTPRSASRSPRGRSVRAASIASHVDHPPPGQWTLNTGIWDPYVGTVPLRAHVPPPRTPAPPALMSTRVFSAFPPVDHTRRQQATSANDPQMSQSVTQNQTNLRAWLRHHQVAQHQMTDSMVKFVSQILDQTRYSPADLFMMKLLVFDPQDHGYAPTDTDKSYYYLIKGNFSQRELPVPTRAAPAMNIQELQHVNLVHASSIGGIQGILTDQKIGPSRLHHRSS